MDKELFKEQSKIYKITVFEDLCLKKSLVLNDFFLVLKEPQIYIWKLNLFRHFLPDSNFNQLIICTFMSQFKLILQGNFPWWSKYSLIRNLAKLV